LEPPVEYIKNYIPNVEENGAVNKDNSITQKEGTKILNLKTINPNEDNKNENEIINEKNKDINGNKIDKKDVKIIKWVDYSNKYGLGYKLNNGQMGVYFNDTTKMILNPDKNEFTYIDKKISDELELLYTFSIDEYPIDLKSKVDLFIEFKNFFEEENSKSKKDEPNSKRRDNEEVEEKKSQERHHHRHKKRKESKNSDEDDQSVNASMKTIEEIDFIFVKKWIKTRHAIIFRLSNKAIQVCFKDKTQIILNIANENVIYINKKGEEDIYPINKALNSSNYEMNKRVKYTKDVLSYMISTNKKKKEISETNSKDNDIK
jgi:polo-like kinase 1